MIIDFFTQPTFFGVFIPFAALTGINTGLIYVILKRMTR